MLVAPLAGAWIETPGIVKVFLMSLVAPLAGAWIETISHRDILVSVARRTPRGCVD